jgi:hypothetical protein|tara:strand:+ start:227 stop:457 length:231 start_codon:yes stop_codon:yes gene_type:complete
MTNPKFGDVVDSNFIYSSEQRKKRKFGDSDIQVEGNPATYHAGDVVHLPYQAGETSTIEAIGLAWGAFASGVDPAE